MPIDIGVIICASQGSKKAIESISEHLYRKARCRINDAVAKWKTDAPTVILSSQLTARDTKLSEVDHYRNAARMFRCLSSSDQPNITNTMDEISVQLLSSLKKIWSQQKSPTTTPVVTPSDVGEITEVYSVNIPSANAVYILRQESQIAIPVIIDTGFSGSLFMSLRSFAMLRSEFLKRGISLPLTRQATSITEAPSKSKIEKEARTPISFGRHSRSQRTTQRSDTSSKAR